MYIRENYNELYHHGILGQKWGVRRYQPYPSGYSGDGKFTGESGPSEKQIKRITKMAKKDAKRYADAKMYYGEGAGTRRKLLKAELDKKKQDPIYKEAFDRAAENADYAKSAQKAKVERKTRDTASTVKKTAVPVVTVGASLYYATHKQEIDSFVVSKMDAAFRAAKNSAQRLQAQRFLRSMGL